MKTFKNTNFSPFLNGFHFPNDFTNKDLSMKWIFSIVRRIILAATIVAPCTGLTWARPEMFCPIFTGTITILIPCPEGKGFMNAWGNGTLSGATQPGTYSACDSSHPCQVTTQGEFTAQTFFGAGGEIGDLQPFTAVATIDFAHPSPNGSGGNCYPIAGKFSVTDSNDSNSTLVMAVQGQGCQLGQDLSALLMTASYLIADDSSGRFSGVSGIGQMNFFVPTGLSGAEPADALFPIAVSGNLHFPGPSPASQAAFPGGSAIRRAEAARVPK